MIKGTLLDIQTALGRDSELYASTVEQFKRLITIFELSRAVMSLRDFDRMLDKIAVETARAFNSEVCLIRLIEKDRLKVRASYGIPRTLHDQLTNSIGEGIAGRGAAQGKTFLVDRAEELSTLSLLARHLTVHTAVSTPLKIGGQVIGTFGLYDKKGPDGAGRDDAEKVRNVIAQHYRQHGARFALLGGDDVDDTGQPLMPVRFCPEYDNSPSDYYFGALDGDWDTDGDGTFCEASEIDYYSEVHIGRATVDTVAEANRWIDKVLL